MSTNGIAEGLTGFLEAALKIGDLYNNAVNAVKYDNTALTQGQQQALIEALTGVCQAGVLGLGQFLTVSATVGTSEAPPVAVGVFALGATASYSLAAEAKGLCNLVSTGLIQGLDATLSNILSLADQAAAPVAVTPQQQLILDAYNSALSTGDFAGMVAAVNQLATDANFVGTINSDGSITYQQGGLAATFTSNWQPISFVLENGDGTSQITTFNPDSSSTSTTFSGPNGTGSITGVDQENADGTSQITIYNSDGSTTTTTYSGANGTGSITEINQDNADDTSQITTYNADGSTTETYYAGPDGGGLITEVDKENANGTSQITIYNADGSSTETYYSGPNGTGTITEVDQENSNSTSEITVIEPDGSSITTDYAGPDGTGGEFAVTGTVDPGSTVNASTDAGSEGTVFSFSGGNSFLNLDYLGGGGPVGVDNVYQGDGIGIDPNIPGYPGPWTLFETEGGNGSYVLFFSDGTVTEVIRLDLPFGDGEPAVGIAPSTTGVDAIFPVINDGTVTLSAPANQTLSLDQFLPSLSISSGAFSALQITGLGSVTVEGSIAIAKLEITGGGGLILQGGSLITDPITVDANGNISGYGTITGGETNNGTITASGGSLDITGDVAGSGTLTFNGSAALTLEGTVAATESLLFTGGGQTLTLGTNASTQAPISGLEYGDAIGIEGQQVTSAVYDVSGEQLAVTDGSGSTFDLAVAGSYQQSNFAVQDGEAMVVCFLRGTQIATPAGEVPVEALSPGDEIVTASGQRRPIVWLGEGRALATRGQRTAATPVVVRKSALADNVPNHDLRVTKAHSLYIDGVLIPVEFLVNHRSILWDDHAQEVSLYHIELETHDVLLANGASAESYRDDGNRWLFQNANSGWDLPPQEPCAPVLTGGPIVDAIWRRLLERASPGRSVPLTQEPDLHLLIDGKRMDAIERRAGMQMFRLPSRPGTARIRSRAAAPQELGLARDPRQLGVAVRRIVLADRTRQWMLAAEETTLAEGFHAFEPDNGIRWTDGDAEIPKELLAGIDGPCMLMLHLGGATQYLDDGKLVRAA